MISGIALHGLGNDALCLFYQLVAEGIRPDSITLLGVLNACSHSGLVDEGHAMLFDMIRLWRIKAKIEHYGCLTVSLPAWVLQRVPTVTRAMALSLSLSLSNISNICL